MLCVLICFLAEIYGFNTPDILYSVYAALWRLPGGQSLHVNVFYSLPSRSTGVGNQVQGTYRGHRHNELVFKGIISGFPVQIFSSRVLQVFVLSLAAIKYLIIFVFSALGLS